MSSISFTLGPEEKFDFALFKEARRLFPFVPNVPARCSQTGSRITMRSCFLLAVIFNWIFNGFNELWAELRLLQHRQPKLKLILRNSDHGENIRASMGIFTIGFRRCKYWKGFDNNDIPCF